MMLKRFLSSLQTEAPDEQTNGDSVKEKVEDELGLDRNLHMELESLKLEQLEIKKEQLKIKKEQLKIKEEELACKHRLLLLQSDKKGGASTAQTSGSNRCILPDGRIVVRAAEKTSRTTMTGRGKRSESLGKGGAKRPRIVLRDNIQVEPSSPSTTPSSPALRSESVQFRTSTPNYIGRPQATVELPPLKPEQEKLVSGALGPGRPGQLLIEQFNLKIRRRDLQTLAGLNWLNDEVINFYMKLLMLRSEERKDLPKVCAADTFFYPKLLQSGQAGLRRWTRKVDIFAYDLMVIPLHLGVHWCVGLIDFRDKRINYLDSMGGRNPACLGALLQYLRDEHEDKKGAPLDDGGWKTECLTDIPQQMNGSDCGILSCTFAEFSARDAPYTFNASHVPYLRRKMALEILTGRLLL